MSAPALSVLVDTYNHESYIEQALLSVIEQDFPSSEMEIVVVDDGSTDRTPEIVSKFGPRVRLLCKKNGGQASAFNAGIAECSGAAIAFLDGDDWFAPGKLSAVAAALEAHPDAAAVGHGYHEVSDDGSTTTFVPPREMLYSPSAPASVRRSLEVWRFILMGALTVRTLALRPVLPLPESLRFCADCPISYAALAGDVYLLDQPLFYYRHHSNNLYAATEGDPERLKAKYKMSEEAFRLSMAMLIRIGVPEQNVDELLLASWADANRRVLTSFGGSRLETFRTEMRSFRFDYKNPSMGYRLYKRIIVGGLTLLLPPKTFYRILHWYARQNLGAVRDRILKSGNAPIPHP